MNERDRLLTCESCGIRFLLTARQLRSHSADGSSLPDVCSGCAALNALVARQRGTVKWFNVRKGYGFLRGENGQDVFLHASGVCVPASARLRSGQAVEFIIEQSERGPIAREVTRIEG